MLDDGTFTYAYDDEGNLTSKTRDASGYFVDKTTTYAWDARNRLTGITQTDSDSVVTLSISYAYNAFDRRIAKVAADGTMLLHQSDGTRAANSRRYVHSQSSQIAFAVQVVHSGCARPAAMFLRRKPNRD